MKRLLFFSMVLLLSACPRRHRPPLPPGAPRPPGWSLEVEVPAAK